MYTHSCVHTHTHIQLRTHSHTLTLTHTLTHTVAYTHNAHKKPTCGLCVEAELIVDAAPRVRELFNAEADEVLAEAEPREPTGDGDQNRGGDRFMVPRHHRSRHHAGGGREHTLIGVVVSALASHRRRGGDAPRTGTRGSDRGSSLRRTRRYE
jgi:hypothetical protein